jgi:hypothetical protein
VKDKPKISDDGAVRRSVHARLGLPVDIKKVKKSKRRVQEVSPEPQRTTFIHSKEDTQGMSLILKCDVIGHWYMHINNVSPMGIDIRSGPQYLFVTRGSLKGWSFG